MKNLRAWIGRLSRENAQDVAEYAVLAAVLLSLVLGVIRLIGLNEFNLLSQVARAIRIN